MTTIREHDPRLHRLLQALPAQIRRSYVWLIQPARRWLRGRSGWR